FGTTTSSASGLIDSTLSGGTKSGYTFATSSSCACSAGPTIVHSFPTRRSSDLPGQTGQRYFCSDQSGVIKFSQTDVATCVSGGNTRRAHTLTTYTGKATIQSEPGNTLPFFFGYDVGQTRLPKINQTKPGMAAEL